MRFPKVGDRLTASTALFVASTGLTVTAPPSGRDVVQRHLEAVGGRATVEKVRSFHARGVYDLPAYQAKGTIDLHFAEPDRLLFHVNLGQLGVIRRGLSGDTGWTVEPGGKPTAVSGKELDGMKKWAARRFSILPGTDEVQAVGKAEVVDFEGRPCHKVTMIIRGTGEKFHDFYDVETGLLAGRRETHHQGGSAVELKGVASEYKRFGDLLIATRWEHEAAGQTWSAVYETIEFNGVEASVFTPPAEIVAPMGTD